MSRSLMRSVLELRTPLTRLPPAFLLPSRALSTTTTTRQSAEAAPSPLQGGSSIPPPGVPTTPSPMPASPRPQKRAPTAPAAAEAAESVSRLFPLLRAQPRHYITAHIHGRPYLVTEGDQVRLPFKMPGVAPGDVLRLDRASVLGSRDYTLKGAPWVDGALFECRATVLGTESEPLRVKVKTKRRNRRSQRVTSKHKYTILRISELKLAEHVG
ncbi:putative aconitate hydratase 2 [Rosellinia necatrix]|uniref:Large ribosomal subunit protein bL21m n=1 Tax=Rosellinia necatrix TaxID=77044 RepID=A0A1S7UKJ4_ROSNE|nr:putative aconitate hydratase 2 [Rosellinia necatrix]